MSPDRGCIEGAERLKKKKVENCKINPMKVNDGRLMGRNMTDTHLSSLQNAVDESCIMFVVASTETQLRRHLAFDQGTWEIFFFGNSITKTII